MELLTLLFNRFFGKINQTGSASQDLTKNETRWEITEKHFNKDKETRKHVICNGEPVEIDWDKVVLWDEEGGLKCGPAQYKSRKAARSVKLFVVHWDACLSSAKMSEVLKERGLSVPFAIDNDGTIYQLMDTKHIAWHAKGVNQQSVGVEIANAVLPKYNEWYEKKGLGKRAIKSGVKLNGAVLTPMLDFYPVQVEALTALLAAVCRAHQIPFKVPLNKDGSLVMGRDDRVAGRLFKGIVGHYHVTVQKSDPAGLPLDTIVKKAELL